MPAFAIQIEKQLLREASALAHQDPKALLALDPSSPMRQVVETIGMLFVFAMHTALKLAPAEEYKRILVKNGCTGIPADCMGRLAVSRGNAMEQQSRMLRPVIRAIRFLAKRHRNRVAVRCRIDVLIDAAVKSSIIDQLREESGLKLNLELLKDAASGDAESLRRLIEIAQALSPRLANTSGPVIAAKSVAHEIILTTLQNLGAFKKYTWSDLEKRHVDEVTNATELQFGISHFDPRPASRRIEESKTRCYERKLFDR